MSKDVNSFLIRFWAGVVVVMAVGLSWEPHAPRFAWGLFIGSVMWLFVLIAYRWVKR